MHQWMFSPVEDGGLTGKGLDNFENLLSNFLHTGHNFFVENPLDGH